MAEKAWHVIGYLLGFLLFYEPFMLFQRITSSFLVETGFTSIHVPCARIPLANILTGQWQYSGPTSLFFCLVLILVSLWFGPLFCGWLCPAGAFSEYLSRLLPDKYKINWAKLVPLVPLRYGFFLGFLSPIILGLGIPCSYCNYYALEIFVGYLHTGQLLSSSPFPAHDLCGEQCFLRPFYKRWAWLLQFTLSGGDNLFSDACVRAVCAWVIWHAG